jgi:hypothetical protein
VRSTRAVTPTPNDPEAAPRTTLKRRSDRWRVHPRRILAWLVLAPTISAIAWQVAASEGFWVQASTVLVGALGAATVAHYVPESGVRPDLGCEPCAVVAGLSVPVSIGLLAGIGPVFGVLVASAGLFQRLRQPATCPA